MNSFGRTSVTFSRHRTRFGPAGSLAILILTLMPALTAGPAEDAQAVAILDTDYQLAVKKNDVAGMSRILADDFVLVTGRGKSFGKSDLLEEARKQTSSYDQQDEIPGTQKVRVWGDAAVVTALLWCKGVRNGAPFDYKLWFSDTYVRTAGGWRYVFGQASLPLPKEELK